MVSVDEGDDVRQAAREALVKHVEYVDLPAQIRAAGEVSPDAQPARVAALRLLAVLKNPAAGDLIERGLSDPNPTTRVAAARAAVDLGDDKSRRLVDAARQRETDPRLQRQLELLLKAFRK